MERVQAYQSTAAYQKALRKRKVWVEPLFAEAKAWHGLRRFRLRRLWRVNSEALMTAAGRTSSDCSPTRMGPPTPAERSGSRSHAALLLDCLRTWDVVPTECRYSYRPPRVAPNARHLLIAA